MKEKNQKQKELNQLLFSAIAIGNLKAVEYWLKVGANINAKDSYNNTPLISAVYNSIFGNDLEVIKLLLVHKADIEVKNIQELTPLKIAIWQDKPVIVKLLIGNGALLDIDPRILTSETQKIIDAASFVDSLFIEGNIKNYQVVENIYSDIFLSRYKYNLSTKGYIKSYQEHIDDINKCCPVLSPEKDALIQSILQDQEDFNMECASIFHTILGVNNPMPMSMIVELLKENGDKEIPEVIQELINFYDKNSSLDSEYVHEYINANYLNEDDRLYEENGLKEEITKANVKIFKNNLAHIFEQCNDNAHASTIINFFDSPLIPAKLIKSIDEYCQLMGSDCQNSEDMKIIDEV